MTEEINYSYDGGLYAELVRNRTFRTARGTDTGISINNGTPRKIAFDKTTGPSAALPQPARDVKTGRRHQHQACATTAAGACRCSPNTTYKGSLYAKADAGDFGPVT